jgi:hypothetical protein
MNELVRLTDPQRRLLAEISAGRVSGFLFTDVPGPGGWVYTLAGRRISASRIEHLMRLGLVRRDEFDRTVDLPQDQRALRLYRVVLVDE